MKILILVFSLSLFFYKNLLETGLEKRVAKCENYLILKIDSLNDYYIIYAKKDSSNYKIVSKKNKYCLLTDSIIKEKKGYFLKLKPLQNKDSLFGVPLSGSYHSTVSTRCIEFDSKTLICNEKGIYDLLYKAENLIGLKIQPEKIDSIKVLKKKKG